MKNTVENLG